MEYFVITLIYELIDGVEYSIYKDCIVNTNDPITLDEFLHSPKYQIEGYRMVGVTNPATISKTATELLLSLQKDTLPALFMGSNVCKR